MSDHNLYGNDDTAFDIIFEKSDTVNQIGTNPGRLIIQGEPLELYNQSQEAHFLHSAIYNYLTSDKFARLSDNSKDTTYSHVKLFLRFLSQHTITNENRLSVLKSYENFRVNNEKVKPQSAGAKQIKSILRSRAAESGLGTQALKYLRFLVSATRTSYKVERQAQTLTSWFESMSWIRGYMRTEDFLSLESAKRLQDSFSTIAAKTLLIIIDAKKQARKQGLSEQENKKCVQHQIDSQNQVYALHDNDKNRLQFRLFNLFRSVYARNIRELMVIDFGVHSAQQTLRDAGEIIYKNPENVSFKIGSVNRPFKEPSIYSEEWEDSVSQCEMILFNWLCCSLMIQPSDVTRLKKRDFSIIKNERGRPLHLQCTYYKSRAYRVHESPIVDAQSGIGQALLQYLAYFNQPSDHLCTEDLSHCSFNPEKPVGKFKPIIGIWKSEYFRSEIQAFVFEHNTSGLFLRAMDVIFKHGSRSPRKESIDKYRASVKNPIPSLWFGGYAIKNTSVHAKSDAYRDNDPLNFNSHSPDTEKRYYLTDNNKDYVNRHGRITRQVISEMEIYQYKPSIQAAMAEAELMSNRTVVSRTSKNDIEEDGDALIVLDTEDTVIWMLHYIDQASEKQSSLIENNIEFFEKTVLPTCEWMEGVLNEKMSPAIVKTGTDRYNELKAHLEPLFMNELSAGVGA